MKSQLAMMRLFPASIKTAEGTKWGYINELGQFVILPKFENAYDFQENGLAIVWSDGLAGVIDQNGQFVIHLKYESIQPFSEGFAVVHEEGQGMKVIDEAGKEITNKAYSFISAFQEGRAVFQDHIHGNDIRYGYLNSKGKIIIPPQYEFANDFHGGKALVRINDRTFALIDMNGKQLQTFPFEQMGVQSEGLVSFKKTNNEKTGYVNESGEIMIPPRFSNAMPFENSRAVVNTSEDIRNQYGLIYKSGEFVIPPNYNEIILLGGNRAAIGEAIDANFPYIGSKFSVADTTNGRFLTGFDFDHVNAYEGEYSSVTKGLTSYFINRNGNKVSNLPSIKGVGTLSLEGNIIKAFVDERISYYERNGKLVWKQNSSIPITRKVRIVERKYRPNKDYLVYYPQIEGMKDESAQAKVNQTLRKESKVKKLPSNEQMNYSYSGDFSVQFLQKNLLVLELTGYEYHFGAAHGMPSKVNIHIDLKSGKIYQLKDLFLLRSDYEKVLSGMIEKKIKEQPDNYFPLDKPIEIKEDQSFYVTKDKLVIYFLPYEIAAFAFGFPEFHIPYEQIKSLINVKGEFWNSFNRNP
ncbi:WG repeat-containing protein [Bacillus sp. T3]|uniref:WG repeat-containing protein n=1 Tax=Bacillus sp. T3 TaxID=467262 RepID=UPI002980EC49|nr:WG repeat-containing protein [Bacillus sp. T3]